MGYSQEETIHHNGVEGQSQFLNRGQGKYIDWNNFTMRTSVGGHKAPHRRSIDIMRLPGCGRGVPGLALAH